MGETRGKLAVLVVLAVSAISVGALMGRSGTGVSASVSTPPQDPGASPEEIVAVHVSGMVVSPGVVDVAPDAMVADGIEAAGGMRPGALVDRINLAAPIVPGQQIVVPGPGSTEQPVSGSGDGPISLRVASAAELETLPGVGPVLAERIVAFRDDVGGFEVVEDLLEVPGIGEAKLAAIRDLVTP